MAERLVRALGVIVLAGDLEVERDDGGLLLSRGQRREMGVKARVRKNAGALSARAGACAGRTVGGAFEVRPQVTETCGPSSSRAAAAAVSPLPSTALPGGRYGFANSAARPSMPCIRTNGNRA